MPDFCVWNRCNNNCWMCTNPADFKDGEVSFSYSRFNLISRLESWKKTIGTDSINLTGGEPTIRPDFIFLLRNIRRIIPQNRIAIVSNGRMFSYPKFAKECLKINNLSLNIALHGPSAQIHDGVTSVKGSFNQTVAGLDNILKYKKPFQEIEVRVVITKMTYKHLGKTVKFIKKRFPNIDRIVLIFMEMEGMAAKNFKRVGLKYNELGSHLNLKIITGWAKGLKDIRLYHFPLCVLDPKLWPYAWRTLRGEEVAYLDSCKKCLYKKYCLGIHRDYLMLVGGGEFEPIKNKINIKTRNYFYHPIVKILEP